MLLRTFLANRSSVTVGHLGTLGLAYGVALGLLFALDGESAQAGRLADLVLWGLIVLAINQVQRFQKHPLVCGMVMIPVLLLPHGAGVLLVGALSFSAQAGRDDMNPRVEILYHLIMGLAAGAGALLHQAFHGSFAAVESEPSVGVVIATLSILMFFGALSLLLTIFPQGQVLPVATQNVRPVRLLIQALLLAMLAFFVQRMYDDPLIGAWGGWSVIFVMGPWLYGYHQISTQAVQVTSMHQRLQATRSAYESLMASLPVGVYRIIPNGRLISANPALAAMLEYDSVDDLLSHRLSEFMMVDAWPEQTMRQWIDALKRQTIVTREGPLRTRHQKTLWVRSTARLIYNADGDIESIDGTVEDITEHHAALEALNHTNELIKQAKQDWEATIDSVSQLVCLLDARQHVIRANLTLEVWGLGTVNGANGQSFHQLMSPLWEHAPDFQQKFATAWTDLSRGVPSAFEAQTPASQQHFLVQVRPVVTQAYREDGSRGSYAVVVVSDITTAKELEEALRQLTEELEDRVTERTEQLASSNNRLQQEIAEREQLALELAEALKKEKELSDFKSQFSSMISHEFRTPMAVILTSVDMLERYHDRLTETQRRDIPARIRQQVKHLNNLLDDIMTVSRAHTIGIDLALEAVDLVSLCDRVCQEARLLNQNRHNLVFEPPPGACPATYVDERLFRQMLGNLISNAYKYSPAGSTVRLAVECQGDTVQLAVHDQGMGVPPEAREHLFDAFFRATNVGAISGTGLGLALVKLVVDLHNGKIEFNSREGEGSTFVITLPVKPAEAEKTTE